MNPRIQLTCPTVKAMQERLHQAYDRGDIRLVRRISVLVEHLLHQVSVSTLSECWDVSVPCVYVWLNELLAHGVASLVYHHGGGRPAKLTPTQKKQLCAWIDDEPQAAGLDGALEDPSDPRIAPAQIGRVVQPFLRL